ncbi:hypothetical protein HMPREF1167_01730, partial [Aeromonas veronii AER39]
MPFNIIYIMRSDGFVRFGGFLDETQPSPTGSTLAGCVN